MFLLPALVAATAALFSPVQQAENPVTVYMDCILSDGRHFLLVEQGKVAVIRLEPAQSFSQVDWGFVDNSLWAQNYTAPNVFRLVYDGDKEHGEISTIFPDKTSVKNEFTCKFTMEK